MTANVTVVGVPPTEQSIPEAAALYARARAMVPTLLELGAATAAARRVPAETIEAFQQAGFFRVLQPRKFGGYQMPFSVFANLVRELAHGCASSAWVYAVTGELGWVMALFPEEAQAEVWRDPAAIGCAAIDAAGHAEETRDGFRLSGRWRFVSGSDHAQWVVLTAPSGERSVIRQFLVARDELETVDDWQVLGLQGTGSRTLVAEKIHVPEHRSITQESMANGTAPGARVHGEHSVYRSPRRYLTAFSLSPVLVGLAERALTIVVDGTARKLSAGQTLPDIESFQLRVAEAAAGVETARAIMDRHLQEADRRLTAGDAIGDFDIQRNRMMASHAIRIARDAVDRLCCVSGSGWIFDNTALSTVFRDTVAGATHRAMNFDANARNFARTLGLRHAEERR